MERHTRGLTCTRTHTLCQHNFHTLAHLVLPVLTSVNIQLSTRAANLLQTFTNTETLNRLTFPRSTCKWTYQSLDPPPYISAGVYQPARTVCWDVVRSSRTLHPRCSVLVHHLVLLHLLHVYLPETVQDQPLFPHQGDRPMRQLPKLKNVWMINGVWPFCVRYAPPSVTLRCSSPLSWWSCLTSSSGCPLRS